MKTLLIYIIFIASIFTGCSKNHDSDSKDEGVNEDQQIEILRAIQSNMSQEEYEYKISAVEEGIKIWKSDIKFEYTESNDKPFLIYFTNRDCLALPDQKLLKVCLVIASHKGSIGIAWPTIGNDSTIENATIIIFNDEFNMNRNSEELSNIIAHEIGHVYGLKHSEDIGSIMNTDPIFMDQPDGEYIDIMQKTIKYKTIPLKYIDKFQMFPPKFDITFHIQTLSARTK